VRDTLFLGGGEKEHQLEGSQAEPARPFDKDRIICAKLVQMTFKNSVRTAKKTPHFTITKINWLTLFKEIIAVYSENHTKHKNTK
jgi:hypothetical protein